MNPTDDLLIERLHVWLERADQLTRLLTLTDKIEVLPLAALAPGPRGRAPAQEETQSVQSDEGTTGPVETIRRDEIGDIATIDWGEEIAKGGWGISSGCFRWSPVFRRSHRSSTGGRKPDKSGTPTGHAPHQFSDEMPPAKGGWVALVLIVLVFASVAFVVERLISVRRKAFLPDALVASTCRKWEAGDLEGAAEEARDDRSAYGRTVRYLARHAPFPKAGGHPRHRLSPGLRECRRAHPRCRETLFRGAAQGTHRTLLNHEI